MSAAQLYARANDAFFDDEYEDAVINYTKSFMVDNTNPEVMLRR